MPAITLSASLLRRQVERKAYAYGVSATVAGLLADYVVDTLRAAAVNRPDPVTHS